MPVASEVAVPGVICCVVNRLAAPMLVVTGSLIPKHVNCQQPKVQVGTKTKKAGLEKPAFLEGLNLHWRHVLSLRSASKERGAA